MDSEGLFKNYFLFSFFSPASFCTLQPPMPFPSARCSTKSALSGRVQHKSKSWEHFRLFIPALLPSCREVLDQVLNPLPSVFPSVKHRKITNLGHTSVCLGMSRVVIYTVLSWFEGLLYSVFHHFKTAMAEGNSLNNLTHLAKRSWRSNCARPLNTHGGEHFCAD